MVPDDPPTEFGQKEMVIKLEIDFAETMEPDDQQSDPLVDSDQTELLIKEEEVESADTMEPDDQQLDPLVDCDREGLPIQPEPADDVERNDDAKKYCAIYITGLQSKRKRTTDDNGNEVTSEQHPRKFCCQICGRGLATARSLARHERRHTEKDDMKAGRPKFCCQMCGKGLSTEGELKRHELRHTRCEFCHRSCANAAALIAHCEKLHGGAKPFLCGVCDERFVSRKLLTRHNNRHHPVIRKPIGDQPRIRYQCSVCPVSTARERALRYHIRKFHESTIKNA